MKALVINGKNEPLSLETRDEPRTGEGEAIVKIHAAALNHRDLWIQKGMYAGLRYPIIPGSDGAGLLIGSDKPVIINPSINWGDKPGHQDQQSFRILGLPDDGTFAEYVKVPASNIVEKPAHLSFEEAAALPLAGLTAYRAVFIRAQVREREKVLITGIGGGVALFALQFALAAGAQVYVTTSDGEKMRDALSMGARDAVNYKDDNWAQELQELAGSFDVIIDGAGGDGMNMLMNLASPGGRLVFYGATRGNPSNVEVRRIFWKQLNILGSTMGSPEDFDAMVAFVNRHHIRPIVDRVFPLAEGEAAMRHMDESRQFGKIVLKVL
ncbi:MAG: zinc-binding dehydrogenase [Bacteroidota bacterium]|nr:zinc-binding dehydrogenase [Bacteroidota bacterium]MDP4215370.1 zinc-binding dehydrogenase [Bacteroidota bacterium]MDP4248166.1 zinc-binding dehydrogenase [Bacteroidota bacterium]MDP4253900.1 zinc-binding dehydrogenase [Bacteroidota bacterium]MDP4259930.1 zinc-binding dehydrogenase [Bacteroidota bacterium]